MTSRTPWLIAGLLLTGMTVALLTQQPHPVQLPLAANPSPSSAPAVPADYPWTHSAFGLETRVLHWPGAGGRQPVSAVRIDPAKCCLRVVDAHRGVDGQGALAAAVCPPDGAAINASYFAEDLTPIGTLIVDGQRICPRHVPGEWGLFLVRNSKPELIKDTGAIPPGVTQALQCKPRLVVAGSLPSFKPQPAARRSAVAIDAAGRVLFVVTDGRLTLEEWAACLRDGLGCADALNLDGGPSTQLIATGKKPLTVPGGWPVPTFLVAAPKQ
jgi:hypothetical protein